MPSLSLLLCVAAGGAAGAVLRWLTGFFLAQNLGTDWPYGTMAVNLSGSFLIGFLSVLLLQKYPDPRLAAFLIAGTWPERPRRALPRRRSAFSSAASSCDPASAGSFIFP